MPVTYSRLGTVLGAGVANHRKPAPPSAEIDWRLFRAHLHDRWGGAAAAWREAGGDYGGINNFWEGSRPALQTQSYLCLCRAMGVDPLAYLVGGARVQTEAA